jgi:hypothetical protein
LKRKANLNSITFSAINGMTVDDIVHFEAELRLR